MQELTQMQKLNSAENTLKMSEYIYVFKQEKILESILSDKGKIRTFHLETEMGIKFEKIKS